MGDFVGLEGHSILQKLKYSYIQSNSPIFKSPPTTPVHAGLLHLCSNTPEMTQYTFFTENPTQQYIQIRARFDVREAQTEIQFPAWRPGRYELGNFAKNVRSFQVFDDSGKPRLAEKTTKDVWQVDTADAKYIEVRYSYFAAELNAGSTYLDDQLLYVNPVNCCVYIKGRENEPCELAIHVPEGRTYAGGLKWDGEKLTAHSYHQLADSPFLFAKKIQHNSYEVNNVVFHLWFHGPAQVDWDRLIHDFKAFTQVQMDDFGEFPVDEYHFLFHIMPFRQYHGVEHLNSTVIVLGPANDLFGAIYEDLLGISSHELYHTWNVKAIRPIELHPYDYSRENYSTMGYLCEGVTTYMGDYYLYRSGVFDTATYRKELETLINRHAENFGRFNYSVKESSWDTWLDGYVPGAPERKVSIYNEGALLAFITDVFVLHHSQNRKGLNDVMRHLYFDYYIKGKGVSEENYLEAIRDTCGSSMQDLFDRFFASRATYETVLNDTLEILGMEMEAYPAASAAHSKLGLKAIQAGDYWQITQLYPGGDADAGGLMVGDKLLAINGYVLEGDLDKWINHFADDVLTVTVNRKGRLVERMLPRLNKNYYLNYKLRRIEKATRFQEQAYRRWSGRKWAEDI
jgi:predicted metalloprotease with PDZ domain